VHVLSWAPRSLNPALSPRCSYRHFLISLTRITVNNLSKLHHLTILIIATSKKDTKTKTKHSRTASKRLIHRRSQGGMPPAKFLAYLVILCFERRCPKQNTAARLRAKYLAPQNFWAGYATGQITLRTKENSQRKKPPTTTDVSTKCQSQICGNSVAHYCESSFVKRHIR